MYSKNTENREEYRAISVEQLKKKEKQTPLQKNQKDPTFINRS